MKTLKTLSVLFIATFAIFAIARIPTVQAQTLDCSDPANRETCLAELAKTEQEITALNAQLDAKKKEGASIKRDKELIDLQIQSAKLRSTARPYYR